MQAGQVKVIRSFNAGRKGQGHQEPSTQAGQVKVITRALNLKPLMVCP